ncbi:MULTISPECIES: hypothetical protein [unclassified Phaeobacter]|uniref:hypothetical protein n=1 Tax=unclassified Phaeobacter TaxID=2621772 RepID=UPI003A83AD13
MKRRLDTILAVAPTYDPYYQTWRVEELVFNGEDRPTWRMRLVPTNEGFVRMDRYDDIESMRSYIEALNNSLSEEVGKIGLSGAEQSSLNLKVEKAVQAKNRLFDEERLMEEQAIARDGANEAPSIDHLVLDLKSEGYRQELYDLLRTIPSLSIAVVGEGGSRRVLFKGSNDTWSKPYNLTKKHAQTAYRARIANPFGLSALSHWGKTKSEIRRILLPRANELLQLAQVKRLLAEALAQGKKALVCNGLVFWYEEDGDIGWQVKQVSNGKSGEGEATWFGGTIESRNHGRLVILPYIKTSGEKVRGHTRNAPNDGKAKPRHPDHYLDIPFEVLDGDLMIELMGHLPYE